MHNPDINDGAARDADGALHPATPVVTTRPGSVATADAAVAAPPGSKSTANAGAGRRPSSMATVANGAGPAGLSTFAPPGIGSVPMSAGAGLAPAAATVRLGAGAGPVSATLANGASNAREGGATAGPIGGAASGAFVRAAEIPGPPPHYVQPLLKTPFHNRARALSQRDSFIPWAGYTTVDVFTNVEQEYFAIRNTTTLYDLTPMVK